MTGSKTTQRVPFLFDCDTEAVKICKQITTQGTCIFYCTAGWKGDLME